MCNGRDFLKDKKRIVVKIGSSSLMHSETGKLDLLKIERLVRALVDIKNSGKEVDAYIQKILFIHTESSFPCSFRQEIKNLAAFATGRTEKRRKPLPLWAESPFRPEGSFRPKSLPFAGRKGFGRIFLRQKGHSRAPEPVLHGETRSTVFWHNSGRPV